MANSNCLEGMSCPSCGQSERFNITATSVFKFVDSGTEDHGDVEFDQDSPISCPDCKWEGWVVQTREHDYMSHLLWESMGDEARQRWKEERGITPKPECLSPYLYKRVAAIYEHTDQEVVFWVGISSGWEPVYLELASRFAITGRPAPRTGYWHIREVGPREKVVPLSKEKIAEMRALRSRIEELRKADKK